MNINIWIQNNYIEIFGAIAGIIYVFLEIKQNIWLWPVGIVTSAVYIWVFFMNKFYADMSLQVYYLVISVLGWYWWTRGTGLRAQGAGQEEKGTGLRAQGAGQEEKGTELRAQGTGQEEKGTELRARSTGQEEKGTGRRAQSAGEEARGTGKERDGEKGREGEVEKEELKISRLKFKTGIYLIVVFVFLYGVMRFVLSELTDSPVPGWDSFITSLSIVATWMLARKIYEHWFLWIIVNSVSAILFTIKGLYPTIILYIIYGVMSFAGLVEWRKAMISSDILPSEN